MSNLTHGIQSDHINTEGLIMFCKIIGIYYETYKHYLQKIFQGPKVKTGSAFNNKLF
jgi:hypothetical protein